MDDIVRLRPQSTYATVSAALALSRGQRVALIFPVGERTCLDELAVIESLRARCQSLGKVAVIIGGDAQLRAHAVAAGFETATTLEDWGVTTPELAAVHQQPTPNGGPRLHLVTSPQTSVSNDNESDGWVSEPPDYVIALRKAYIGPSPVVRAPVITGSLARVLLDEDDDDAITASERFEEIVVGRILATSGIHRPEMPGAL